MKRFMSVLVAALMLLTPASVLAFDSGQKAEDHPTDTTITWTGQGVTGGELDEEKCGENADVPDGTDPDDYLHWILTVDGGSLASDPTLNLGGSGSGSYAPADKDSNAYHFYTPSSDLDTLTAYADIDIATTGAGAWILTISHGCAPDELEEAAALTVTKTANASYDNTYVWDITKVVDQTYVEQDSGTVTLNYTVVVSHDGGTIGNIELSGKITVTNPNDEDVTLDSISDELSDGTVCDVDITAGLVVGTGDTDFDYTCDVTALPEGQLDNIVEIVWSEQTLADDSHLAAGTAGFTVSDIQFAGNDVDECVVVEDTNSNGPNETVCVGDPGEVDNAFTFTYQRVVDVPALGSCITVDNTASFTTNDTETTDSASTETRICAFRDALTQGYWRNHLAPISATCKSKDGCSANGPWTTDLLGDPICGGNCVAGKLSSTYTAATYQEAKKVFDANNCSNASTSNKNAASCLAAQLLAAELNVANVANDCICDTIADAKAFLTAVGYDGPNDANGVTFSGSNTRAYAIELKTDLDNYNNGLGCPE
jgi:hypothetical protein